MAHISTQDPDHPGSFDVTSRQDGSSIFGPHPENTLLFEAPINSGSILLSGSASELRPFSRRVYRPRDAAEAARPPPPYQKTIDPTYCQDTDLVHGEQEQPRLFTITAPAPRVTATPRIDGFGSIDAGAQQRHPSAMPACAVKAPPPDVSPRSFCNSPVYQSTHEASFTTLVEPAFQTNTVTENRSPALVIAAIPVAYPSKVASAVMNDTLSYFSRPPNITNSKSSSAAAFLTEDILVLEPPDALCAVAPPAAPTTITCTLMIRHIKVLPYPASEAVVALVGTYFYPWVFWSLSLGVSIAIGLGSEIGFTVLVLAMFAWYIPAIMTVDATAWRIALNVPNVLILVNSVVNVWAIIRISHHNSTSPATSLASVLFFGVFPIAYALATVMDHDMYGILVAAPSIVFSMLAVVVKFYVRGEFVGSFFGADIDIMFFRYHVSPLVIVANNFLQILPIAVRVIVFARDSRSGYPQRLVGKAGSISVKYRTFATDRALDNKTHFRLILVGHALAFIATGLAIWHGESE
jgi:hypothetical protein